MSKRTRDIDFHVYLNKDENQILENLCSRLRVNRSVLIRALILGKRLVEAPPIDYKQFIVELRRVGTNLNQLTAKANSIGYIDADECKNVLNEVRKLESDISKYFKPGEVSPEEAQQVAMEVANKMWGCGYPVETSAQQKHRPSREARPDYEMIVATHLNANCVHNHFCQGENEFFVSVIELLSPSIHKKPPRIFSPQRFNNNIFTLPSRS